MDFYCMFMNFCTFFRALFCINKTATPEINRCMIDNKKIYSFRGRESVAGCYSPTEKSIRF